MSDDPTPPHVFVARRAALPAQPLTALWSAANINKLVGILGLLGALYTVVVWGVGPVKPQSQIDLDQQKTRVTDLAADLASRTTALAAELAKQTSALAADQAARASALSNDIAAIRASPGGSLRQQDIKDWTAYHDIAVVIPAIRDYWMPQRVITAKNQS
jgi:hypothetical protein